MALAKHCGKSHWPDYAVEAVADVIQRSRMGLRNPHRPVWLISIFGNFGRGENRAS